MLNVWLVLAQRLTELLVPARRQALAEIHAATAAEATVQYAAVETLPEFERRTRAEVAAQLTDVRRQVKKRSFAYKDALLLNEFLK